MLKRISIFLIIHLVYQVSATGQVFHSEEEVIQFQTRLQLQNFVNSLLSYPFESLEKKEIGVVVAEIKLMPADRKDSVYICNSVSPDIDQIMINALKIALINYREELISISEDSKITFYTLYRIENNEYEISYKNIPEQLIGPMKITINNTITNSASQSPALVVKINPDSYYRDKIKECRQKIRDLEAGSENAAPLRQKVNAKLIAQQEKQIIKNLDELIRRNPFNPELREQRAGLYRQQNDIPNTDKDILFIKNYIKQPESQ